METTQWGLLGAAFVASLVESVEALTIVLAMGMTRGWKSAMLGTGAAVALAIGAVLLGSGARDPLALAPLAAALLLVALMVSLVIDVRKHCRRITRGRIQ